MSEQRVALQCECGQLLSARFQDAGSHLSCKCNNTVKVPSLGKLRQLAGKDAYITNPVEAIQKQINLGEAPAGTKCLLCQSTSADLYRYLAICESMHMKNVESKSSNDIAYLLGKLFFIFTMPRLLLFLFLKDKRNDEVEPLGRDISVEIALPVCLPCTESGHNAKKPRVARQLMQKVSLYQQLLDTYPDLKLESR